MNRCDIWASILEVQKISDKPAAMRVSIPDGLTHIEAVVSIPEACTRPNELRVGMRVYVCGGLLRGQLMPGLPWIEAQYVAEIKPGERESAEDGPSYMSLIEGIKIDKPRSRRQVAEEAKGLAS
jgi:hypothetical protein